MDQGAYYMAAVILSGLSLIIAAFSFFRTGDWRRTEAGKEVDGKFVKLEQRISTMETRMDGVPAKLSSIDTRMTTVETRLLDMPTRADIAKVSAELDAVQDDVRLVRAGITRIEDYLLERSK